MVELVETSDKDSDEDESESEWECELNPAERPEGSEQEWMMLRDQKLGRQAVMFRPFVTSGIKYY